MTFLLKRFRLMIQLFISVHLLTQIWLKEIIWKPGQFSSTHQDMNQERAGIGITIQRYMPQK